jgi:hypothetical protein
VTKDAHATRVRRELGATIWGASVGCSHQLSPVVSCQRLEAPGARLLLGHVYVSQEGRAIYPTANAEQPVSWYGWCTSPLDLYEASLYH